MTVRAGSNLGRWLEEHSSDPISTRPKLPEVIGALDGSGCRRASAQPVMLLDRGSTPPRAARRKVCKCQLSVDARLSTVKARSSARRC